jgi:hypothetical protein
MLIVHKFDTPMGCCDGEMLIGGTHGDSIILDISEQKQLLAWFCKNHPRWVIELTRENVDIEEWEWL